MHKAEPNLRGCYPHTYNELHGGNSNLLNYSVLSVTPVLRSQVYNQVLEARSSLSSMAFSAKN